jgi:hypothetical protein
MEAWERDARRRHGIDALHSHGAAAGRLLAGAQVQQSATLDELRGNLEQLATNLKSLNSFRVVDIAVVPGPEVCRSPSPLCCCATARVCVCVCVCVSRERASVVAEQGSTLQLGVPLREHLTSCL